MDFAFSAEVADLGGVPEQFHSLYDLDKASNQYKLSSDPKVKGAVEAVVGLNKALGKAREDVAAAKKGRVDLSGLKDFGDSPDKILETFNAKLKELQDLLASKSKIDPDKIREDMKAAHAKALEGMEARITGLKSQLYGLNVESAYKTAAAAEGADDLDLLMPFVKERLDVVEEDGQVKVYVVEEQKQADGTRKRRYGATGGDMTMLELIKEMKGGKYGRFFKSTAKSGGGASPGGASGRQASRTENKGDLTSKDKISQGLNGRTSAGAGARK